MAPELKAKKRKGATETSPSSKKLKKADSKDAATTKPEAAKPAEITIPETVNPVAVKARATRKRAADYLGGEETVGAALNGATEESAKPKKAKKAKVNGATDVDGESEPKKSKKSATTEQPSAAAAVEKKGKASKSKKSKSAPEPEEEEAETKNAGENGSEENDDIDDQTAALLKGFESDEEDVEDDGKAIEEIPSIPNEKKLRKQLDQAQQDDDEPGVVYVGRVPHGFYEHQMKAYFTQFGDITRLRLSRNAKTGKSRHFAFIEFASSEVAAIVAKAMDKYLLFGHILQVKTIPKEQVHEDLFKGANQRFRPMPRNKIAARNLRLPKTKEVWEKKTRKEEGRRQKKLDKLKEIGYEFEAPQLKSVTDVDTSSKAIEAAPEEAAPEDAPKLLTETAHIEEEAEPKIEKARITKKSKTVRSVSDGTGKLTKQLVVEAVEVTTKPKTTRKTRKST